MKLAPKSLLVLPPERPAAPWLTVGRRDRRLPAREQHRLARDLRTLGLFIRVYCDARHSDQPRSAVSLKTHNVSALSRRKVVLCADCRKLLTHALIKRAHCPYVPKPTCKHCPSHCYDPKYRTRIREVMRVAGRRLVLSGRVDYLWHLFF